MNCLYVNNNALNRGVFFEPCPINTLNVWQFNFSFCQMKITFSEQRNEIFFVFVLHLYIVLLYWTLRLLQTNVETHVLAHLVGACSIKFCTCWKLMLFVWFLRGIVARIWKVIVARARKKCKRLLRFDFMTTNSGGNGYYAHSSVISLIGISHGEMVMQHWK